MTSLREAIDGIVPIRPREVRLAHEGAAATWGLVDLEGAEDEGPPPTALYRADGLALLYPGMVNTIQGEPTSGKSWLALMACCEEITDGNHVLYLDFEADKRSVGARLRALGLTTEEIGERFHYVRPEERMGKAARARLREHLETLKPSLVVIDGVAEALALEGYKENDSGDIATFRNRLSRVCATSGAVVLEIDHVVKAKGKQGLDPRGSGTKRGGVQGASYIATVDRGKGFMRGKSGVGRLTVAKDRHGFSGVPGAIAAVVYYDAQADGSLAIELVDPRHPRDVEGADRLSVMMRRLALVIEARPGLDTRSVREAVLGKHAHKTQALAQLVAEGYIEIRRSQQARLHYSLRPYPNDDAPVSKGGVV